MKEPLTIYKVVNIINLKETFVFDHYFNRSMAVERRDAEKTYAKDNEQVVITTAVVYPDHILSGDDIVNFPF